ncbi:PNKP [Lepeophtheirus salmonis]|uniref:PNKP n=1 Tax=Lepeophtheirus salmonis TaxID=72036 RepID=A0A7R8CCN1_LEPSM|nr:PNKP [Lepeophtheirus salmonis]CAF2772938.1 PNKP [Lepeophtheirus salmonis]
MINESGSKLIKNEAQIMITPNARDPNPKLAVYDMDGTIITTKSGNVFPKNTDDWQIIYPTVPGKLKSLVKEGYKIVIYTNQAGVAKGKTSLTDIVTKIENIFLKRLGIPVAVLVCTSSGGFFRKPRTGLWEIFVSRYNGGLIDKSSSFYVGDAAGRDKGWKAGKKKDFSNSDRLFALNIEFQFHTPEEHFLGERPTENYTMPSFDPYNFKKPSSLLDPHDSELEVVNTQEVIMMVGMQGSGKSFFARKNALSSGKSVIVDNTHPEAATRAKYLNIIAKYDDVRARCFVMNTNPSHARHNNLFRELIGEEHAKVNEILFNQYTNKFEPPQLTEGFHSIVSVNFIPKFSSEEQENLYNTHLLEK